MKKVLIILLFITPAISKAQVGWSFTNYSLLAGQQYRFHQQPSWSIDLQYDRFRINCRSHTLYHGLGINYSFNNHQSELGIKGMWNPTLYRLSISYSTRLYPYLFGQANFIQTKRDDQTVSENKQPGNYSFRPGIGITGNFREDKALNIKAYVQLGYTIVTDQMQSANPWTVELKLGLGINPLRLKRNSENG